MIPNISPHSAGKPRLSAKKARSSERAWVPGLEKVGFSNNSNNSDNSFQSDYHGKQNGNYSGNVGIIWQSVGDREESSAPMSGKRVAQHLFGTDVHPS